jgi:hypothetical protein
MATLKFGVQLPGCQSRRPLLPLKDWLYKKAALTFGKNPVSP